MWKRASVVAVDMGYGHLRAAYPLRHLSPDGQIILANNYPGIPAADLQLWNGSSKFYEYVSRLNNIPLIGTYLFAAFEDQWEKDTFHYQKYHDPLLRDYVKKAFEITDMADYAKFDIRLDSSGRYYFIDSNSNPAFGPKELDCALANILDLYDINFTEILKRLLLNTIRDSQGKERLPLVKSKHSAA